MPGRWSGGRKDLLGCRLVGLPHVCPVDAAAPGSRRSPAGKTPDSGYPSAARVRSAHVPLSTLRRFGSVRPTATRDRDYDRVSAGLRCRLIGCTLSVRWAPWATPCVAWRHRDPPSSACGSAEGGGHGDGHSDQSASGTARASVKKRSRRRRHNHVPLTRRRLSRPHILHGDPGGTRTRRASRMRFGFVRRPRTWSTITTNPTTGLVDLPRPSVSERPGLDLRAGLIPG